MSIFLSTANYFRGFINTQEKDFSYKGHSMDEIIHHLAVFVSRLWQKGILLLNEQNELKNRNLHISGLLNEEKVDIQSEKSGY